MSLGSKIERFSKKLTSGVLRNTHGLPLKAATTYIGAMVAGGIGVVAFQDPSVVSTIQQTLGDRSLDVGNLMASKMFDVGAIGGAASLAALAVTKAFKDPIKALERWSNNNPVDILYKASKKEMVKEGQGQSYLKDRLDAMSLNERKEFNDFIQKGYESSRELGYNTFTRQGVDIREGVSAYRQLMKAELSNDQSQKVDNKKEFQPSTDFSY